MPRPRKSVPAYRRQKQKNRPDRAFVVVHGKREYLGAYGTPESRERYARIVAELAAGVDPRQPDRITLVELTASYARYIKQVFTDDHGIVTEHGVQLIRCAKAAAKLYGREPADEFGPRALKAVRESFLAAGQCRENVNRNVRAVVRMFKWAVGEELIPASTWHALQAVEGLRRGRTKAPEGRKVQPVAAEHVEAVKPYVSRQVWAILELLMLTGARPGEICSMRPCDIDTTGDVWVYRPATHKTMYKGKDRDIFIGPKAQQVVRPFLETRSRLDQPLFSPAEAEDERLAKAHEARKTPLRYGNRPGTNRSDDPAKQPGEQYHPSAVRRAVERACDKAFPLPRDLATAPDGETVADRQERRAAAKQWRKDHRWHPYQLRHTAATRFRRDFGLEAAQVLLGHSRADTTQIYAEVNASKAIEVAAAVG